MKMSTCFVAISFLALIASAAAQTSPSNSETPSASIQVPRLIRFSGTAKDQTGKPLSGVLGITFALYQDEQGGAPLWLETQNVEADTNGHYSVMLGADSQEGLPLDLFTSGEARWLGVRAGAQQEQPRVLLVSVPYAIKAHEAETLSGKTISDFVLLNDTKTLLAGTSNKQINSNSAGSLNQLTTNGPTNFAGSNSTQIVGVTQSGSGTGLSATAHTHPAVAGTITGPTSGGAAVQGLNNATSGVSQGVSGSTSSVTTNSSGVNGFEAATTGQVYGVVGSTNSHTANAAGVSGFEGAATGRVFGVQGGTNSTTQGAAAVNGFEGASTGQVYGVNGSTNSTTNFAAGVSGYEGATTGQVFGVFGSTASTSGTGVNGIASATTGNTNGVYGQTSSPSGFGVFGLNSSSGSQLLSAGVFGLSTATSGASWGVKGSSNSNNGVGVEGFSIAVGVRGQGLICSTSGCVPQAADAGQFITASGGNILHGFLNTAGTWTEMFRVDSGGNGYFAGNLNVKGTLSKGSGSFKIDDPLDPAHKYLSHSFVESPDMMNVYNGNVTTDKHGLATVALPDYFEALNRDFRYQLTVIGQFAQAIVAKKISNNRFVVRTSKPGVEVSWQVTGIRHDAYADAYRIPVEEEKPPQEQGHYLHPELYEDSEYQAIGTALSGPSTRSVPPRERP